MGEALARSVPASPAGPSHGTNPGWISVRSCPRPTGPASSCRMQELIEDGWSQADVARELGVTRQVIQKVLSILDGTTDRLAALHRNVRKSAAIRSCTMPA